MLAVIVQRLNTLTSVDSAFVARIAMIVKDVAIATIVIVVHTALCVLHAKIAQIVRVARTVTI
jgi:hypothetical protein